MKLSRAREPAAATLLVEAVLIRNPPIKQSALSCCANKQAI